MGNTSALSPVGGSCTATACTAGYKVECGMASNGTAPASADCGLNTFADTMCSANQQLNGVRVTVGSCHNVDQSALGGAYLSAIATACASQGSVLTAKSIRATSCIGPSLAQAPGTFTATCYSAVDCTGAFTTTTVSTTTVMTNATTTVV